MIVTVNSFRAIYEPPHDKMTSASSEHSDQHGQWASAQSDESLSWLLEETSEP